MSQICSQMVQKNRKFHIIFYCLKLCPNKNIFSIKEKSLELQHCSHWAQVSKSSVLQFLVFFVNLYGLYEIIALFFSYFYIKCHFPTLLLTHNLNILPRHKYQLLFQESNSGFWHQLIGLKSSCQHLPAVGSQITSHLCTSVSILMRCA